MAEDFISRPRTWDQGQGMLSRPRPRPLLFVLEATRGRGQVLEAPRGRGQVLEDTSPVNISE